MSKPLPYIPHKRVKRDGKVDLWDIQIEGGPLKIEFTGILAREALQRDPERFKLDLPRGMKPGPAQEEADRRAAEAQAEADAEAPDPVYGRKAS